MELMAEVDRVRNGLRIRRGRFVMRHLRRPVRWGNLRRTTPVSPSYGFDRGVPVDRHYIDAFVKRHGGDLVGHVLEVGGSSYTRKYGHADRTTVVDYTPANPRATLVADLNQAGSLPAATFDAALIPQTFQYLDPQTALANLWQSLVPGGVLLLTIPSLGRLDPDIPDLDLHRWTQAGILKELDRAGISGEVTSYGNVLACVCALYGLTVQDVGAEQLDIFDPAFPLTICVRAVKPPH